MIGLPKFSFHHTAHQLTVGVIAMSLVFALFQSVGGAHLVMIPGLVFERWEVWQPFTALLIARGPMEVLFGGLIIYSCGSALESRWGKSRFLWFVLGIPAVAMVLTLALSLVVSDLYTTPFYGVGSLLTTVWVGYGLMAWFSGTQLGFFSVPMTGKTFALVGIGMVLLNGAYGSFGMVLPELISAALAYNYFYNSWFERVREQVENRFDTWKLARLKAKRGFKVIVNEAPPKDNRHLH